MTCPVCPNWHMSYLESLNCEQNDNRVLFWHFIDYSEMTKYHLSLLILILRITNRKDKGSVTRVKTNQNGNFVQERNIRFFFILSTLVFRLFINNMAI